MNKCSLVHLWHHLFWKLWLISHLREQDTVSYRPMVCGLHCRHSWGHGKCESHTKKQWKWLAQRLQQDSAAPLALGLLSAKEEGGACRIQKPIEKVFARRSSAKTRLDWAPADLWTSRKELWRYTCPIYRKKELRGSCLTSHSQGYGSGWTGKFWIKGDLLEDLKAPWTVEKKDSRKQSSEQTKESKDPNLIKQNGRGSRRPKGGGSQARTQASLFEFQNLNKLWKQQYPTLLAAEEKEESFSLWYSWAVHGTVLWHQWITTATASEPRGDNGNTWIWL